MSWEPDRRRRSIRLKGYDYTRPGAYFVTLCAHERACLFGAIVDGAMRLNGYGEVVREEWLRTAALHSHVELDAFVVMPNHMHGIIIITGDTVGARCIVPLPPPQTESFGKPVPGSIPTLIRLFKAAATRRINHLRGTPGAPVWQRNYYEHIVRSEDGLRRIREYISTNPIRWDDDPENPARRVAWP